MNNLRLTFFSCCLLLLCQGCIYKSVSITGSAPGLNDAIIEIYSGDERWDDRVSGDKFKLDPQIKKEGFYNLEIHWGRHDRTYVIYLEKGHYDIRFQPGNGAVYPDVTSSSDLQEEVPITVQQKGKTMKGPGAGS